MLLKEGFPNSAGLRLVLDDSAGGEAGGSTSNTSVTRRYQIPQFLLLWS